MTSESQIDNIFFYIPEKSKVEIRLKNHLCLKNDAANLSSHDVLVGEVILPSLHLEASTSDYSSTYSDFIVKKPKWNQDGLEGYQKDSLMFLQRLTNKYNTVENIPILCELFSKALVLSGENNFETTNPTYKSKKSTLPYFSSAYKAAHTTHQRVFKEWRNAGRPSDLAHPAKQAVLESRRALQIIRRTEENTKSIKLHDDLITTFDTDKNKIYMKLKKSRGENPKTIDIPFIETLAGKFYGTDVLEGFAQNTEILHPV